MKTLKIALVLVLVATGCSIYGAIHYHNKSRDLAISLYQGWVKTTLADQADFALSLSFETVLDLLDSQPIEAHFVFGDTTARTWWEIDHNKEYADGAPIEKLNVLIVADVDSKHGRIQGSKSVRFSRPPERTWFEKEGDRIVSEMTEKANGHVDSMLDELADSF